MLSVKTDDGYARFKRKLKPRRPGHERRWLYYFEYRGERYFFVVGEAARPITILDDNFTITKRGKEHHLVRKGRYKTKKAQRKYSQGRRPI